MRAPGLVLLLAVCAAGTAHAEKIRINQSAKMYKRQGERSAVLVKLKAGDKVTKIGQDGRWIHIRTGGFTGWIPRSVADVPDDDTIPRNTRRRAFVDGRGTDRGSLGGTTPDDRVGGDAVDSDSGSDKDSDSDKGSKGKGSKGKGGKADKADRDSGDKGDKDDKDDKDSDDKGDGDKGDGDKDKDADEPKRPTAHVTGKTTIYSDKTKDSDAAFTAKPDDVLFVGKTSGKWTEVENSEGDFGYALTSKLEISDDGGEGGGAPLKQQINLRGRLGATYVQQGLRTAGSTSTTVPDNYNLSVAAATIALGGMYLRPYSKDIAIGGDFAFSAAKAVPGIQYTPMGGMTTTTSFSIYDVDLRGIVGYDLHKKSGAMLVGRLGFRYDSFQVSDVGNLTKNPATIPSEIQISPAIGAGILLPRLGPSYGLGFILDGMFTASDKQTKGLEDGKSPSAKGICAELAFNYHYSKAFDIQAAYDLKYMSASYGAVDPMSVRNHAGTSVSRTDINHMITVGISKSL